MTLRNGSNLKINTKIKGIFTKENYFKHLHHNYINMGMIDEDSLFLEAEQASDESLNIVMESEGDNTQDTPEQSTKPEPKEETDNTSTGSGTQNYDMGDFGGDDSSEDDPFDGDDKEQEDELTTGLPTDDQYYVVLLKDINRKIIKLNEVSLKLLTKSDKTESKIINKIDSLTYIFNRFVEKYTEYDNAKATVLDLRSMTDNIIKFVDIYLSRREGDIYRPYIGFRISANTRLQFLSDYCKRK